MFCPPLTASQSTKQAPIPTRTNFPAEPLPEGGGVGVAQPVPVAGGAGYQQCADKKKNPVPVLLDPGNECCIEAVHMCCLLYDGPVVAL